MSVYPVVYVLTVQNTIRDYKVTTNKDFDGQTIESVEELTKAKQYLVQEFINNKYKECIGIYDDEKQAHKAGEKYCVKHNYPCYRVDKVNLIDLIDNLI